MISLGRKNNIETCATPSKEKNKMQYPYLNINDIDLGLSDDDVGKTLKAMIEIKVNSVGKRINNSEKEVKKTFSYSFDVLNIDFGKKAKSETPDKDWDIKDILKYRKDHPEE